MKLPAALSWSGFESVGFYCRLQTIALARRGSIEEYRTPWETQSRFDVFNLDRSFAERLVRAGLGDRLMFGTDAVYWPEATHRSVKSIETAPFLTEQQKRDIFYNNAARFPRLEQ